MKICPICKIEKPYTEFNKNKSTKDGYQWLCSICRKQSRLLNKSTISEQHRKYYQLNKTVIIESVKKYRSLNVAKVSANGKKYYQLNLTKINERVRERSKLNILKRKEYLKEYRQTKHGKLTIKASNYRRIVSVKVNTPSGKHWTPADIILKLKLQNYKCIYCETSIKEYYEIDHFIPLCKGGSNEANNIQLLCKGCNSSGGKGAKLPHDYAQKHGKLF